MFPASPALHETAVVGRRVWIWDGDKWLQMPFSTTQLGVGTHPPTYALDVDGDCNLSAGSVYRINGVPLSFPQTPWASNIDGANFLLNNARGIGIGTTADISTGIRILTPMMYSTGLYIKKSNPATNTTANAHIILANDLDHKLEFGVTSSATTGIWITTDTSYIAVDGSLSVLTATNERMRITEAGLVGIGTATPAYPLDIAGDVNISTGSVYRIGGVPISTGGGGTPAGANTQIQWNNNNAFGASSSLAWNDTNTTLTVSGNASTWGGVLNLRSQVPLNLSPESSINVYADAASPSQLYTTLRFLAAEGITPPTIQIGIAPTAGAPVAYIWQLAAAYMSVNGVLTVAPGPASSDRSYAFKVQTSGGQPRLVVDNNNGDVGIGNDGVPPFSIPGYPHLIVGPQVASPQCGIVTACGNTTNPGASVGSFAFANYSLVSPDKRIAAIRGDTGPTIDSGNLSFNTWNAGAPMPRMVITAAGNVGIGNDGTGPFSAPGFSHLIVGPIVPTVNACGIITACGSTATANALAGQLAFANYGASSADTRVATITCLTESNADSARLVFSTYENSSPNGSMVLTAGGNVGVGTVSPFARLDIVGAGGDPGVNPVVRMGGGTGNVLEMGAIQGAPFAVWLQTRDRSTPYPYSLLLNPLGGSVGIGTTSPSASLTVSSGSLPTTAGSVLNSFDVGANTPNGDTLRALVARVSDGNGWDTAIWRLRRQVDASAIADIDFGHFTIALRTNDLTRMTVASNGFVGIGQMFPAAPLDVNGMCAAWVFGGHAPSNYSACLDVESDRGIPTGQPTNTLTFAFTTSNNILTLIMVRPDGTQRAANIQM